MSAHQATPRYRRALSRWTVMVFAAVGVAAVPATSAVAAQTPLETGCPAGFQTLSVATLLGLGYRAPGQIDDPANGGNADGMICGNPINPTRAAQICGGPCSVPVLYEFRDNTLTPLH